MKGMQPVSEDTCMQASGPVEPASVCDVHSLQTNLTCIELVESAIMQGTHLKLMYGACLCRAKKDTEIKEAVEVQDNLFGGPEGKEFPTIFASKDAPRSNVDNALPQGDGGEREGTSRRRITRMTTLMCSELCGDDHQRLHS